MNQQPTFNIKKEEANAKYGRFVVEPLEQGYGQTLGSSLRRVLLSSLPGAAVTQVSIAGLKHQFGSIKGVREDGVDLLLNLKKLRVQYAGDKPARLTLEAKGAGEVTAAQIKTPGDVRVVNPDLVLGTLSDAKTKLDMDMQVETGVGYSPADERKTNTIGLIPVDADFSPIKRVNYRVEETRVGRLTNYDKLTIELWGDGTVDPEEAITRAANILVAYFGQVANPQLQVVQPVQVVAVDPSQARAGALSIEELGLPTRISNALSKAGFESVSDLLKADKGELAKVRNMGEKSIKVIEIALKEKGVSWD